jgi:hypothetical protein
VGLWTEVSLARGKGKGEIEGAYHSPPGARADVLLVGSNEPNELTLFSIKQLFITLVTSLV